MFLQGLSAVLKGAPVHYIIRRSLRSTEKA